MHYLFYKFLCFFSGLLREAIVDFQAFMCKQTLPYRFSYIIFFISKIRKLDKTSQGKAPRGQGRSRQFIYKQLCFYAYYTFKYSIMFMSIFVLLSIYKKKGHIVLPLPLIEVLNAFFNSIVLRATKAVASKQCFKFLKIDSVQYMGFV